MCLSHPQALLFLCFIVLLTTPIEAQDEVLLTDISPPAGPLDVQRLTMVNLTVVRLPDGETNLRGYVRAELLDGNLNSVVSLQSLPLTLTIGQQLGYTSIPWTTTPQYGTAQAASTLRTTGRLYQGDYLVCHEFILSTDERIIGRQCHEKQAALDINFSLVYPNDGAVVENVRPQLVWEGVAGYGLLQGGISYDIQLVERLAGQPPAAALETNPTLVDWRGHTVSNLLYPPALPPLERGKHYAWQVMVRQNGNQILISQPWAFTVGEANSVPAPPPPTASYVMPSTKASTRTHRFGSFIRLGFDNNEGLELLTYSIDKITGKILPVKKLPVIGDLQPGLNTLDIPTASMGLEEGQTYRLSIATPRKQYYLLQFTYDPTL